MSAYSIPPDLAEFAERLRRSATELQLLIRERPELTGQSFNGDISTSTQLSVADLPSDSVGISIGRYNVLIGILPDVPASQAVSECLRRYRNQCVVARSFLSGNESLDLQLLLIGPRGSERQDAWRALALMVERDDRVARKLAWLRPEDPRRDDESFAEFVGRSFLARPWQGADSFSDVALDELSGSGAVGEGLPRTTADEWERIALDSSKEPEELVEELVRAWQKRVAS